MKKVSINKLFPIADLHPKGWLLCQLKIQAEGLSGNLDKIWPDVKDSAWIGGQCEGWERVPYWLDGFIPLALFLRDENLLARAREYVEAIAERQQADGWICPVPTEQSADYDVWACFLIGKVFALWAEETGDARIEASLRSSMLCLYEKLKKGEVRIFDWAKSRWFEGLIPLLYLREKQDEPWISELGKMLHEEGTDWNELKALWVKPLFQWTQETHIVNIAMMIKANALYEAFCGQKPGRSSEALYRYLRKYNGTAVETLAGDECLAGLANNRGTELCSVVELMYSFEWLYRLTGDETWLDRLEKCGFNALPATLSDDMWTHQYDQMVNQIACKPFPGKPVFGTNSREAHLFGLEPSYGCCTANFSQGWPKLAMNALQRDAKGLIIAMPLPMALSTTVFGPSLNLEIGGAYPFRHRIFVSISVDAPLNLSLRIRIPGWAKGFSVNGVPGNGGKGLCELGRCFTGKTTFEIEFFAEPTLAKRPYGLSALEYGSLVYALPLKTTYLQKEYEAYGVVRKYPYCDYELSTEDEWRFGFSSDDFEVSYGDGDGIPFSSLHPSVSVKTLLAPVDWDFEEGFTTVSGRKPNSNKALGQAREMELIPYGCAKLRITEMPLCPKSAKPKS